jgi:endonuclease I
MKAYKALVKYALANGCSIRVASEGEWIGKRSTKYTEIISDIESCDYSEIIIRKGVEKVGWADIVLEYDQPHDESVSDWSVNDFMSGWEKEYFR